MRIDIRPLPPTPEFPTKNFSEHRSRMEILQRRAGQTKQCYSCKGNHPPYIGVSETGSAKTGSAIDVRIDDAGSILNFRIGFSLWFSGVVSQLRPSCPIDFGRHRGLILNFRIGFLSSIGGRLPYPCLPTPFPILRLQRETGRDLEFCVWKSCPSKRPRIPRILCRSVPTCHAWCIGGR